MISSKQSQPKRLIDSLGRQITYLRVSLTEQCNLRCGYCYGTVNRSDSNKRELTDREILHLIKVFESLGINKVRFTGGEPLLRRSIVDLTKKISSLDCISLIGLTTNGLVLNQYLHPLIDAGLNRLNVSLDSLNRNTFQKITSVDGFDRVYSGIINAEKSGAFNRVKVNTVVMRGINDNEILNFAEWALSRRIDIRFIEFMPAMNSAWGRELFVSESEMRSMMNLNLVKEPTNEKSSGPAVSYRVEDYPGRVSFISAVSRCFCNECNRLRLTSKGDLIGCLFGRNGINLKNLLIDDTTAEETADYLRIAVAKTGFRRLPEKVSISGLKPFMRGVGG